MPVREEKPRRRGEQQETKKQDAVDRYREHFIQLKKPDTPAKLPKSLSTISSEQISDLMLTYTTWREYLEDLLVEALADFTYTKEKYDHEYNKVLLQTEAKTVKEKEAIVSVDSSVRKLYLTLQQAELFYNLLSSKLESYNNCLTVISREITRRTNKDA